MRDGARTGNDRRGLRRAASCLAVVLAASLAGAAFPTGASAHPGGLHKDDDDTTTTTTDPTGPQPPTTSTPKPTTSTTITTTTTTAPPPPPPPPTYVEPPQTTTVPVTAAPPTTARVEETAAVEVVEVDTGNTFTTIANLLVPGDGTPGAQATTTTTIGAQGSSTDDESRLIWMVIGGLAGVALLVGLLTWRYWALTRPGRNLEDESDADYGGYDQPYADSYGDDSYSDDSYNDGYDPLAGDGAADGQPWDTPWDEPSATRAMRDGPAPGGTAAMPASPQDPWADAALGWPGQPARPEPPSRGDDWWGDGPTGARADQERHGPQGWPTAPANDRPGSRPLRERGRGQPAPPQTGRRAAPGRPGVPDGAPDGRRGRGGAGQVQQGRPRPSDGAGPRRGGPARASAEPGRPRPPAAGRPGERGGDQQGRGQPGRGQQGRGQQGRGQQGRGQPRPDGGASRRPQAPPSDQPRRGGGAGAGGRRGTRRPGAAPDQTGRGAGRNRPSAPRDPRGRRPDDPPHDDPWDGPRRRR